MPEILKIVQQTKQKFLNMFEFTVQDRSGRVHPIMWLPERLKLQA